MSTTVNYKGSTIATVNNETKTLNTAGTWVEGDITLVDNSTVDYQVTYSMVGGAYATATPAKALAGEGFTSKIKVPAGHTLQGITVTMGGVDITNQVVEYDEIEEEPHTIMYNLTNGATANVTPTKILADEGFSVKLTVPTGYELSDVSVTMGGVDVTASVFEYD